MSILPGIYTNRNEINGGFELSRGKLMLDAAPAFLVRTKDEIKSVAGDRKKVGEDGRGDNSVYPYG